MEELSFNVSARTARLIGRENVGSAQAAIIELIKNGYDADSSEVVVKLKNDTLIIADNGDGMTHDVIKNSWMKIGTDNKDVSPISKNGRVKSGAKGIGRFALDKLGKKVTMMTCSRETGDVYEWSIDWELFNQPGINVSDVNALLSNIDKEKFDTAQKLGYVCDQAMATLEILRTRANVRQVPHFDKYCLWLGYRGKTLLGSIAESGSIILKQKIELWARRCMELGIEPVIKISRVEKQQFLQEETA